MAGPAASAARWYRKAALLLSLALFLSFGLFGGVEKSPVLRAQSSPGEEPSAGVEVRAPAAVLMDAHSGQILYAKNPDQPRAPASVTKVMTLTLAMEALREGKLRLDDRVTVSRRAARWGNVGTTAFLEEGEEMKVEDLIYAVAVASANDAAVALAERIAGSEAQFVALMNRRARELGMSRTRWANPHGYPGPGQHYTSARDLALLSRYLVREFPEALRYTSTWEHWLRRGTRRETWLTNFNRGLIEYPGMDGLKTGWTDEAGFCLAATARQGKRRLIAVVMGSPTPKERNEDVYRLLDWGFSAFENASFGERGKPVGKVGVREGREEEVEVRPEDDLVLTVPRGEAGQVRLELSLPPAVEAPVGEGKKLGRARLVQGGRVRREVRLLAARSVPRADIWSFSLRLWRRMLGLSDPAPRSLRVPSSAFGAPPFPGQGRAVP